MTLNFTDHELMRLIRRRVQQTPPIPMTQIATELGYGVDELCAFIMAYKEPKTYRYQKDGPPIAISVSYDGKKIETESDLYKARKMEAWRRQHNGAAATRLLMQDITLDPVGSMEKEAGVK